MILGENITFSGMISSYQGQAEIIFGTPTKIK
jgi:hypothetical protein